MTKDDVLDPGQLRATVTLMATGFSAVVPVLAVEPVPEDEGGPADTGPWVGGLAGAGLTRATEEGLLPRPAGWAVMAVFLSLGRVHVVVRSPGAETFFAGTCAAADGWLDLTAQTGNCLLLAGRPGLADVPRADLTPGRVAEMVSMAGAAGLLAGGLVPVSTPVAGPGSGTGPRPRALGAGGHRGFPGKLNVNREAYSPDGDLLDAIPGGPPPLHASGVPHFAAQGPPFGRPADDDAREPDGWSAHLDEALTAVRAEALGMSREQVRQRLVAELLGRGEMPPSRAVDHYVDDIMRTVGASGTGSRGTSWHAAGGAAKAGLRVLRGAEALVSRRPAPHWHARGMHRVVPDWRAPRLEVIVDHDGAKWLAVGEEDVVEVWLGVTAGDTACPGTEDPLVVYRGDEPVGILGADADPVYRPIVLESRHADVVVTTAAIRSRAVDASWRLRVCSPAQGLGAVIETFMAGGR
jgi:hypothetical protein